MTSKAKTSRKKPRTGENSVTAKRKAKGKIRGNDQPGKIASHKREPIGSENDAPRDALVRKKLVAPKRIALTERVASLLKKTGLLRARGMTWKEVGREIGVAANTVSRWAIDQREEYLKWLTHYEDQVIMEQSAIAGSFQMQLIEEALAPGADVPTKKLGESAAHSVKAHRAKLFPLRQVHEVGESVTSVVERLAKAARSPAAWQYATPAKVIAVESTAEPAEAEPLE